MGMIGLVRDLEPDTPQQWRESAQQWRDQAAAFVAHADYEEGRGNDASTYRVMAQRCTEAAELMDRRASELEQPRESKPLTAAQVRMMFDALDRAAEMRK